MSGSDANVELEVRVDDPATEVFLVDSNFQRVQSGVGSLRAEVPPGFYKIRYRTGGNLRDEMIEVEPGAVRKEIHASAVPIQSSAPISGTTSAHEYQEAEWFAADTRVDVDLGGSASLLLLLRDPDAGRNKRSGHVPWNGVELADASGRVIFQAGDAGHADEAAGVAAITARLPQGTYLLRVRSGIAATMESPIAVCDYWRTHVALVSQSQRRQTEKGTRVVRRADPLTAAIFMAREGSVASAPDEARHQLRLVELARQALIQYRENVSLSVLNETLNSKWENPMVGILGAHLLLRTPEPDPGLVQQVIYNLRNLVPSHPDARALAIGTAKDQAEVEALDFTFPEPPMLVYSWLMIVQAAVKTPGLIPPGSLSEQVAPSLLSGEPWLAWRGISRAPAGKDGAKVDTQVLGSQLRQMAAEGPETSNSFDQAVVQAAQAASDEADDEELVSNVVKQLNVPPATLARAARRAKY